MIEVTVGILKVIDELPHSLNVFRGEIINRAHLSKTHVLNERHNALHSLDYGKEALGISTAGGEVEARGAAELVALALGHAVERVAYADIGVKEVCHPGNEPRVEELIEGFELLGNSLGGSLARKSGEILLEFLPRHLLFLHIKG